MRDEKIKNYIEIKPSRGRKVVRGFGIAILMFAAFTVVASVVGEPFLARTLVFGIILIIVSLLMIRVGRVRKQELKQNTITSTAAEEQEVENKKPERGNYPDDQSFENAMMKYLHDTDQVVRPRLEPIKWEKLDANRTPPAQPPSRSQPPSKGGGATSGGFVLGAILAIIGFLMLIYGSWAMYWANSTYSNFYLMGGGFMFFIGLLVMAMAHEYEKTKDPAFMARREKRRKYRENARRKKVGY